MLLLAIVQTTALKWSYIHTKTSEYMNCSHLYSSLDMTGLRNSKLQDNNEMKLQQG